MRACYKSQKILEFGPYGKEGIRYEPRESSSGRFVHVGGKSRRKIVCAGASRRQTDVFTTGASTIWREPAGNLARRPVSDRSACRANRDAVPPGRNSPGPVCGELSISSRNPPRYPAQFVPRIGDERRCSRAWRPRRICCRPRRRLHNYGDCSTRASSSSSSRPTTASAPRSPKRPAFPPYGPVAWRFRPNLAYATTTKPVGPRFSKCWSSWPTPRRSPSCWTATPATAISTMPAAWSENSNSATSPASAWRTSCFPRPTVSSPARGRNWPTSKNFRARSRRPKMPSSTKTSSSWRASKPSSPDAAWVRRCSGPRPISRPARTPS